MLICAGCDKSGNEIYSRCGHILHQTCLGNTYRTCPSCEIKLSDKKKAERFLYKLKSSTFHDEAEADELFICMENIIESGSKCPLIILEKLLNFGWDINVNELGGPSLFYRACRTDNLEIVNLLIESGLNLSKYGTKGLNYACLHSNIDIVDRLMQSGLVKLDESVLFEVILKRKIKMLEKILNYGVDVDIKDSRGRRLIHVAAKTGSIRMVQFLVENGADFNAVDEEGNSILHYVCYSDENTQLLKYFMEVGFDFTNVKNKKGQTPLLTAIEAENRLITRVFMKSGADLHVCDSEGDFPLHFCIKNKKYKMIKLLILEGRLDVNMKNSNGYTPLQMVDSSTPKIDDIVTLLLDNGADINVLDTDGKSPLANLHQWIDKKLKRRFINGGADLNMKTGENRNLLSDMLSSI